jgi:hypothetical protein
MMRRYTSLTKSWGWLKTIWGNFNSNSERMKNIWSSSMNNLSCWRKSVARWSSRSVTKRMLNYRKSHQSNSCTHSRILCSCKSNLRSLKSKSSRKSRSWNSRSRSRTNTWGSCRVSYLSCRHRLRNVTGSTARMSWRSKSSGGSCRRDCWSRLITSIGSSSRYRHNCRNLARCQNRQLINSNTSLWCKRVQRSKSGRRSLRLWGLHQHIKPRTHNSEMS